LSKDNETGELRLYLLYSVGQSGGHFGAGEAIVMPILQLSLPDHYVEHAKPSEMLAECRLDAAGIEAAVRKRLVLLGDA